MSSLPADPACRDESQEPVASLEPFAKLMRDHYGTRILEGPFQGLIYGDRSFGSMYWPKLLGTYEKELSACFTAHNLCQYDLFLNLGCAEGYYANGIAYSLNQSSRRPGAEIIAIDTDQEALIELQRISKLNQLQVRVGEAFHPAMLPEARRVLVIADLEGAEMELLTAAQFPLLEWTDFIIEVHDGHGPANILHELLKRFTPTHAASVLPFKHRLVADFPAAISFPVADGLKLQAMDERRVKGLEWLILNAKGQ